MAEAEDVERQLERARLAVLKACACWAEWVAPPPDREVRLSDGEYADRGLQRIGLAPLAPRLPLRLRWKYAPGDGVREVCGQGA